MSRSVEVITTLLNDNDTSLFSSFYTALTIKLYIEVIQHIQFIFSRNTSCALNNAKTRSTPPPPQKKKKTKQNKTKNKNHIYIYLLIHAYLPFLVKIKISKISTTVPQYQHDNIFTCNNGVASHRVCKLQNRVHSTSSCK